MPNCKGEELSALATAIAINISNNTSNEDSALLGALFTSIGDQLALISLTNDNPSNPCAENISTKCCDEA